jgi:hypothetical protein
MVETWSRGGGRWGQFDHPSKLGVSKWRCRLVVNEEQTKPNSTKVKVDG